VGPEVTPLSYFAAFIFPKICERVLHAVAFQVFEKECDGIPFSGRWHFARLVERLIWRRMFGCAENYMGKPRQEKMATAQQRIDSPQKGQL
jgi:hypothetical protein